VSAGSKSQLFSTVNEIDEEPVSLGFQLSKNF